MADIAFGEYTLVNDNTLKYNNNSQDRDIYWIDNNDGQGKRPAIENVKGYFTSNTDALAVNGTFTYQDGIETETIPLENIPYESVTKSTSSIALTDLGGTGHWSLRVSDLLSDGKLIIDGQTYTGTFSDWELVYADPSTLDEVASMDGYAAVMVTSVNDAGTPVDQAGRERVSAAGKLGWYFVEETDYVANISVRCGTTNFDTELVKTAIENNYSLTWKTGLKDADGNDLNKGSFPLSSQEGWLTFRWVDDPNVKGELLFGTAAVKGLERFNLDGSELIFNIDGTNNGDPVKITDIRDEGGNNILTDGDYLAESIENNAVSNWGTNVDQVYSGGTLILTLTGTTEYTATKEWQDEDKDENTVRPQADFYLWRFTKTSEEDDYLKTAYQTASPVKDTGGQTAQFTISEGSTIDSQTIDFSSEFGKNQIDYLPKYDQEGFTYVYLSREYMSGEDVDKYKTVYGKVSENDVDVVTDTLIYDGERTSIDNSIYNGGTVSNMLSGNTTAGVTKTWEAAYFQSELTDVTVELTLQKSDDDGRTWTNTETVYTMGKTNPFYAEFLSQSHSETMPKYDNYGRLLQYRWIESAVYQRENSADNLLPDLVSNPMTFTLTQNGQQVEYTSTATMTRDQNGNYYTEIINKIEDETEYYVRKVWGQNVDPEPVDLIIYRTNALNQQQMLLPGEGNTKGKFQIDGTADPTPTDLYYNGEVVGQVQEVSSWVVAYTKLQKYDTDGSGFDYVVLEGQNNKFQAQYSSGKIQLPDGTEVDGFIITNVGPGTGTELNLRKRWLDEGDEQHRGTVTFTVYEIKDLTHTDPADRFASGNLENLGDFEIDRSTNWWRKVWLEGKIDSKNLLVLETKIAATDGGSAVELSYSCEDMADIYAIQQAQPAADVPDDYYTYNTAYHKYEAFYSMVDLNGVGFYTVTNRRLGRVDIDVTKYWKDGSSGTEMSAKRQELKTALDKEGYNLVLYLQCSSREAKIDYVNGTVSFGHEKMDILDQQNQKTGAIQVIDLTGSSGNINAALYQFYNLPKYDMYGRLVTYTVTEMALPQNEKGDTGIKTVKEALGSDTFDSLEYTFSGGTTSYQPNHDGKQSDKQTVGVTNALTGTKEVVFWKEWNDAYRYKRNERPDIYLELYRLYHETGESETAKEKLEDLYLDRTWTFTSEEISYCEFGSLNKYDDLGYEIFYYAQERYTVDKEQFDYIDVYYKYDATLTPNKVSAGDDQSTIKQIEAAPVIGDEKNGFDASPPSDSTLLAQNGNVWLLKENGIFVNDLAADVTFNGKKIWANIPAGFLDADLPKVTFSLYRFTEGVNQNIPTDDDPDTAYEDYGDNIVSRLIIEDWDQQLVKGEYPFVIKYEGININERSGDGGTIICTSGEPEAEKQKIPLPKYDSNGNLYAYRFREDAELLQNTDIGAVFNQPTINNYAIRNPYDSDLGYLTVKKILDISDYEDSLGKYPVVSFKLTRQYSNETDDLVDDTVFQKIESIDFGTGDNTEQALTFDNLEMYAPNGSKYVYTVTELSADDGGLIQGGFQVYAKIGNLDSTADFGTDEAKSVTGLYPKEKQSVGQQLLNFITSIPQLLGITPRETDTSYATFKNEYEKEYAPLRFTKYWDDAGQSNLRFVTPLTFTVSYKADSQPGMNNAIASRTGGSFTIALDATDKNLQRVDLTKDNRKLKVNPSANKEDPVNTIEKVTVSVPDGYTLSNYQYWTIEVTKFLIYAPTGMPWKYTLEEKDVYPYVITGNKREFSYDKTNNRFTCGSNLYTNTARIERSATKNPVSVSEPNTDYNSGVTGIWNLSGYDVTLNFELYAKVVEAENWEEAKGKFLADANDWFSLASDTDLKENQQTLKNVLEETGGSTCKFEDSYTYKNNASYGKHQMKTANLLRTVDDGEKILFVSYFYSETGLEMKDTDGTVVYKQSFTPNFMITTVPAGLPSGISQTIYKADDPVVAYYFTTRAHILTEKATNKNKYEGTQYFYMTPAFQSETDVEKKVLTLNMKYEEWLPYVWITGYADNVSSTKNYINDQFNYIDMLDLDVTKEWKDDNRNIYDTRPEKNGQWVVDYQIQQSLDSGATWTDFDAGARYLSITGTDSEDTKTVSYRNLPAGGIVKKADGSGYKVVESYQYRIREKNPENGNQITEEWFNEAYKVTYSGPVITGASEGKNEKWALTATNTLEIIDLYAQKSWNDENLTSPVTLELQYQSGTDDEKKPIWESFDTPAKVTLDGIVNTSAVYYEYDSWKAKWTGVPKVMPGSETTETGGEKQTNYRVVEVSENAYGSDEDGNALTGTGTETDPYVLDNPATGSSDFTVTNELTQIKVQKTVEKPDGATLKNPEEEFTFTISEGDIPTGVKYKVYNSDNSAAQAVTELTNKTFKLEDGQYAIIYGLKKGETYKVTESGSGYEVSYKLNGTKQQNGQVEVPNSKPQAPVTIPTLEVINEKRGKVTVSKTDATGNQFEGATFKLELKVATDADRTQTDADWTQIGTEVTTGNDGKAVFSNLAFGTYRLTETSTKDGYNKLAKPIEFTIPLKNDDSTGNYFYSITNGNDTSYYYPEITLTVKNDQAFAMPSTSGSGFFWPGIMGMAAAVGAAGYYAVYNKKKKRRGRLNN